MTDELKVGGMKPAAHYNGETISLDVEKDASPLANTARLMHKAAVHHIGEGGWQSAVNKARVFFAKSGILGWQPDDAGTLMDIVPCPKPHEGEWGYRIQFAAINAGQVHVIKVIYPLSELKQ